MALGWGTCQEGRALRVTGQSSRLLVPISAWTLLSFWAPVPRAACSFELTQHCHGSLCPQLDPCCGVCELPQGWGTICSLTVPKEPETKHLSARLPRDLAAASLGCPSSQPRP